MTRPRPLASHADPVRRCACALRVGLVVAIALLFAGCPAIETDKTDVGIVEDYVGATLDIEVTYRAEDGATVADEASANALSRVQLEAAAVETRGFRVDSTPDRLLVCKALHNPPGLLRDLEINRFVAATLLAAVEDREITLYRGDAIQSETPLRALVHGLRETEDPVEVDFSTRAFAITDGVSPRLFAFERAALRVPLEKVVVSFEESGSKIARMTLRVDDAATIDAISKAVGWPEPAPSVTDFEASAQRVLEQRRLLVAIGGVVLIDDVIRPGGQLVLEGDVPTWVVAGFVRDRDRRWLDPTLTRRSGRVAGGCRLSIRYEGTTSPVELERLGGQPPFTR